MRIQKGLKTAAKSTSEITCYTKGYAVKCFQALPHLTRLGKYILSEMQTILLRSKEDDSFLAFICLPIRQEGI